MRGVRSTYVVRVTEAPEGVRVEVEDESGETLRDHGWQENHERAFALAGRTIDERREP